MGFCKGRERESMTVKTSRKARPAKHISFTRTTFARLETYLKQHFPGHHALSMIVDMAVEEYLERHDRNGEV